MDKLEIVIQKQIGRGIVGPMGSYRKLILGIKCLGFQINSQLCIANSFPLSSIVRYQSVSGSVGGYMPLGTVGGARKGSWSLSGA